MHPAPPERLKNLKRILEEEHESVQLESSAVDAAVAIILNPTADDAEVLFIAREEREEDPWAGHVAFPGGKVQPEDGSLFETVAREVGEEVGIDVRHSLSPLGALPAQSPANRPEMKVLPYVFEVKDKPHLELGEEVRDTFWAPLSSLRPSEGTARVMVQGEEMNFPAYHVGGHVVWGFTYRVLKSFLELWDSTLESEEE